LKEILDLKFEVIITGVYAYGFSNADWLGRKIDEETVKALIKLNKRYGVSLVGKGANMKPLCLTPHFSGKS
jgi:diphthamide synthase (EF-2-diphthine--ammonia ligase)